MRVSGTARQNQQAGLTLVELIVAIAIFSVILLATVSLYTTSLKTYVRDKATQDLQREGDAILAHMSRTIKEGTALDAANSNFTSNPNTLSFYINGTQKRKYYVSGSQIHYVDENNNDTDLMSPGSTDIALTFTPTSDTNGNLVAVRIQSTLQRVRYGISTTLNVGSTISTRPQ